MQIYLDHNATAPLHPAAAAALRAHVEPGRTENPSSLHRTGQVARGTLEDARRTIAGLLGASAPELVFTASGSEANALALRGTIATASTARARVLASAIEHPSVLATLEACRRERPDLRVELLPVDREGQLDLAAAERALGPDVLLVSLMLANNETGVVQPVRELARLARVQGAIVHCDAAQAVGKIPVDVAELGVDLLSAGAHKFGAGLGCGLLIVRRGVSLSPQLAGHQEAGRRGSTENVAAIAAAAAALGAHTTELGAARQRISALRERMEGGVLERVPRSRLHGANAQRLPNTANLEFAGADGEAVLIALDLEGISVSTGAACASGTLEPSHVLLAQGLTTAEAKASVRFSLGSTTTQREIEAVLDVLPGVVQRVRAHAPMR